MLGLRPAWKDEKGKLKVETDLLWLRPMWKEEKGKLKVETDARASPYVERGKGKAES
jgi:hypothetical protein